MKKYEPQKFIDAITRKMNGQSIPTCPFCKGTRFTSTDQLASVIVGDTIDSLQIGSSIPAGVIICENCGHINFFALGALGLLEKKEETKDV